MEQNNQVDASPNLEASQPPAVPNAQPQIGLNPQSPVSAPGVLSGDIKKYFIYVLVGGIIVFALISIGAILIGQFNDITTKALLSTLSIVIHSLLALAFVSTRAGDNNRYTRFIINILFALILASLLTSLMSIWGAIDSILSSKLYGFYFLVFFASLYCLAIIKSQLKDNLSVIAGNTSMVITLIFTAYLMPFVFLDNRVDLGDFYYRLLAVLAILLGTSTVLTAIFHKLYQSKHPEQKRAKGKTPVWLIVLLIIIAFTFLQSLTGVLF